MPEMSFLPARAAGYHDPRTLHRTWAILFLVSLVLYAATANRGAQWQDSGEFIIRIMTGEHVSQLGLALSHPLHHWLGRLAILPGLLEPAYAITLISSLAAALAVANLYGCVQTLTGRGSAALFAAASLALANTFWHLATTAEVYTLTVALLTAECWCLAAYARTPRKTYLWGMLLFNGLGLANHLQATLTTPVLLAVLFYALRKRRLTPRDAAIGCILWLVGSLPYTGLVAAEWIRSGDLGATLGSALFGKSWSSQVLRAAPSRRTLLISLTAIPYNFPHLLLPAAFYGIAVSSRRRLGVPPLARRALLAALLLHAVFALRYDVVDQHTFFLPLYALLATFGGIGAAATFLWAHPRQRRRAGAAAALLLLATPLVYELTFSLARRYDLLHGVVHHKPYRDDYAYLLLPWAVVDASAERMSSQALALARDDGWIIVEDPMARFAVEYKKLRAGRQAVQITLLPPASHSDERADLARRMREAADLGRPVVLVPLNADQPETDPLANQGGHWERVGDLYLLDAR